MNLLWMTFLAFDWTPLTSSSLTEPPVLVREEVLDWDEIRARASLVTSRQLHIPATLGNAMDACESRQRLVTPNHLRPYPNEVGHWSATRLTPEHWPYRVQTIEYVLGHEDKSSYSLDATLEHTVTLYASTRDTPPPSATPIAQITHSLESAIDGGNLVSWTLEEPFELEEDEHLYVVIQHTGPWPDVLSVLLCPAVSDPGGWWSNAINQPYDWEHLTGFNIPDTPMVQAYGDELHP